MKASFRFDLEDVDDRTEFKKYIQTDNMYCALHHIEDLFRKANKHGTPFGGEELSEVELALMDKLSDKFYEIIKEFNVDLDV